MIPQVPPPPADEPKIAPYQPDEPLIAAVQRGGRPRLALYRPAGVQVVLGRGSKVERELHPGAIRRDGVALLRRRGGGCAVVLDPGNLVLSLVQPVAGIGNNPAHFARITAWLLGALGRVGIAGLRQRGISDLALGEHKVGGSCIYRTRGLLYYSTTLLVSAELPLIERYLCHPPREPDYRAGRPHARFVRNLGGPAGPFAGDAGALLQRLAPLLRADDPALDPGQRE